MVGRRVGGIHLLPVIYERLDIVITRLAACPVRTLGAPGLMNHAPTRYYSLSDRRWETKENRNLRVIWVFQLISLQDPNMRTADLGESPRRIED